MFAAQLAAALVVWAATIFLLHRRRAKLLSHFGAVPRGRRSASAASLMISSVAILLLTMGGLASGGLREGGLTWWGWLLVAFAGASFIALQTIALVPLALNASQPVTPRTAKTSDTKDQSQS